MGGKVVQVAPKSNGGKLARSFTMSSKKMMGKLALANSKMMVMEKSVFHSTVFKINPLSKPIQDPADYNKCSVFWGFALYVGVVVYFVWAFLDYQNRPIVTTNSLESVVNYAPIKIGLMVQCRYWGWTCTKGSTKVNGKWTIGEGPRIFTLDKDGKKTILRSLDTTPPIFHSWFGNSSYEDAVMIDIPMDPEKSDFSTGLYLWAAGFSSPPTCSGAYGDSCLSHLKVTVFDPVDMVNGEVADGKMKIELDLLPYQDKIVFPALSVRRTKISADALPHEKKNVDESKKYTDSNGQAYEIEDRIVYLDDLFYKGKFNENAAKLGIMMKSLANVRTDDRPGSILLVLSSVGGAFALLVPLLRVLNSVTDALLTKCNCSKLLVPHTEDVHADEDLELAATTGSETER